ncbi:MAG: lysophospholipid acyltransferase family protein [Deltaproteobacteria bacterium]|nr:lysophospholipid acyltransferase family protein [Deltaproteobacteria bacterium]
MHRLARELRRAIRYDGLFWRRFAYLGSAYGPWWWRRYSPTAIGAIFWAVLPEKRRIVLENLGRILDRRAAASRIARERIALQTFVNFARCLTDCLEAAGPNPPEFEVETDGDRILGEALSRGRGGVMVTAHLGNWELIGRLVCRKGFPITVAMARERNESVRGFVEWHRGQEGVEIVYTDGSVFGALDMLRVLRANRILALQLDRPSGGDGDRVVPFFGVPTRFPLGPFLLAQAAGAPVLPVFTFLAGHHRYVVEQGDIGVVGRKGGVAAAQAALDSTVRMLEDAVRRHPDQWFHFTAIGGEGWAAPGA